MDVVTSVKKRVISMLMAMLMVLPYAVTFAPKAEAATSNWGTGTETITVTTKSNWWYPGSESITLAQSKGTRTNETYNWWKRRYQTKTTKCYGRWQIEGKSTDGTHTIKKTLSGSSVKIKLKGNKTYELVVSWDSDFDLIESMDKGDFTSIPSWWVKSTHKVSNYW